MIILQIENYCKDCPDFEVVQYTDKTYFNETYGNVCVSAEHILTCKHKHRCKSLMEYLKRTDKKNENIRN